MLFDYLIDKINAADIDQYPFAHIQIDDFFDAQHFSEIVAAHEIALKPAASDEALFDTLFANGWRIIGFPGCITDRKIYIGWHGKRKGKLYNNSSCEGFGVTLRLVAATSPIIAQLTDFMASDPFKKVLADRFNIDLTDVFYDGGVQKYLDGYEISPHPDIRRKALTYMININPNAQSEREEHHTHYLILKDSFKYVESYWEGHPSEDRCWLPWDWCESKKEQRKNNSIVIFSPNNRTIHGVKAKYDHLQYQRTQLYGNLWYTEKQELESPDWEDLMIHPGQHKLRVQASSLHNRIKAAIPGPVKYFIKRKILGADRDKNLIAERKNTVY